LPIDRLARSIVSVIARKPAGSNRFQPVFFIGQPCIGNDDPTSLAGQINHAWVQSSQLFPWNRELFYVDDIGGALRPSEGFKVMRREDSRGICLTVPEFSHWFSDSCSITSAVDRSPDL
jgi:hypothetical protein